MRKVRFEANGVLYRTLTTTFARAPKPALSKANTAVKIDLSFRLTECQGHDYSWRKATRRQDAVRVKSAIFHECTSNVRYYFTTRRSN